MNVRRFLPRMLSSGLFAAVGLALTVFVLADPPAFAMGSLPADGTAIVASGPGSFLVPLALFGGIAVAWLFTQCLAPLTVRRLAIAGVLGAITAAVLFSPIPAMAADTATDTSVSIPWGSWLSSGAGALIEVLVAALVAAVTWLASKVSTPIATLLKTLLTEQLLQRAVTYGINAVAGAAHDKELSIKVSNDVVRTALQYAISHGPAWLISWLGTPDHIAEMIIARLKLEPGAAVSLTGTDVVDASEASTAPAPSPS